MRIDKEEFKRVIIPCGRRMFVTARVILGDDEEASDAVQQAIIKLWEQHDTLPELINPEMFCQTVIKRICLNILRSRRKWVGDEILVTVGSENNDFENRDQLNHLRNLISRLPENQQKVLNLSVFGECSNEEISELTGESGANVRQLLSRARKKLKKLYKLSYE